MVTSEGKLMSIDGDSGRGSSMVLFGHASHLFCDAVVEKYPFKERLLSKGSLCYDFKDRVRRELQF